MLVTAVAAATSPIGLDVDFPAFLARSDPTWRWGSSAANRTRRPEEWVESLFGGNGDLGFMLWSPEPALLRLEVSKKSLWDDRTPDLVTPPSVLARNKTYYTNDFVHDQPRLPSGHFELTWGSKEEAPILAVGRVDLHAARAALDVTTTASGPDAPGLRRVALEHGEPRLERAAGVAPRQRGGAQRRELAIG